MSYILLGVFFGVLLGGLFLMDSFSYTEQNSHVAHSLPQTWTAPAPEGYIVFTN